MTERLHTRVRSGIRLDERGRFWHDGELVKHPAIVRAWSRGLERAADGRYLIRFGSDWAFVTVDDAPFVVRRVVEGEEGLEVLLPDDTREPLDPRFLARSPEQVVYCRVKGDHRARLSRQAQLDLMPFLREEGGGFFFTFGDRSWPIGDNPGHPPPRPEDGPAPPDDEGPPRRSAQ
ncbi:MAG TPA: DUF1285 domain-containing protein [Vulgatibacter sp.]